jgi:glycosyltransferase involved in cell wall biosynthesis
MKVLFMNRNSGAGVEFEGNIFISILERTIGIDTIDVYKTQCRNLFSKFDFSVYDLIILNDLSIGEYDQNKLNIGVPIININFGGTGNRSEVVDIVMDINIPYTSYSEDDMFNYYPINFISGNIWNKFTEWEERSNRILYVSRLVEQKILPEFIEYVRSIGEKIDFYGLLISEDYYNKNKDVIDYKGFIDHKELLNIYNKYKSVYLFSTTECLSMTIREAILCGTVPIIYDNIHYSKAIEEYVVKCDGPTPDTINLYDKVLTKHNKIEKEYKYITNYLSFDKMIIDFIFCLRGLLLKDFKFNRSYRANINVLHNEGPERSIIYKNDTIDWNKIGI